MSLHSNIPVFLSDRGCPHRCAFCNQRAVTGFDPVTPEGAKRIIEDALASIQANRAERVEIAYFGGSFSGLPVFEQEAFLALAYEYKKQGRVMGIRLSTRPDLIDKEVLDRFVRYGVTAVELGAQSLDDGVLALNQRGHTAKDTERAAREIRERGISLGLQMMIGLRGDSLTKAMATARGIVALGAESTRIYPAVVLKGTLLAQWYQEGLYRPLTVAEAVDWCCSLVPVFEAGGVTILRMGLMASEGLLSGEELAAGPFHSSFGELVASELMLRAAQDELKKRETKAKKIVIFVAPRAMSQMTGHRKNNVARLINEFGLEKLTIAPGEGLTGRNMKIVDA